MNTELFFQTIHSVNQFGTYGAVANRCEHFGLTEEEKGRANFSVDKMLTKFTTRRSTTLGIASNNSTWKQDARKVLCFEALASKIQLTQCAKKLTSNIV